MFTFVSRDVTKLQNYYQKSLIAKKSSQRLHVSINVSNIQKENIVSNFFLKNLYVETEEKSMVNNFKETQELMRYGQKDCQHVNLFELSVF